MILELEIGKFQRREWLEIYAIDRDLTIQFCGQVCHYLFTDKGLHRTKLEGKHSQAKQQANTAYCN
jgi:hypothetical protein